MMTWRCCVLQHQQQVATAVERAKQVTMTELNAIIGVSTELIKPRMRCIKLKQEKNIS
jgi:hypothetical protein